MITKHIKIPYQGQEIDLEVRPNTQDEPMARSEVFNDYYFKYGNLKINPGDTVLDLGANVGSFSIYAALLGAKKIYATEPHPETIEILERNVKNYPVEIIKAAVMGKHDDEATFYLNNDPYGTGSHTLTLNTTDNQASFKTLKVKALSLDELLDTYDIQQVDFCKADIEGAEYEMLENSVRLDRIKQFSCEWHHGILNLARLLMFMTTHGFITAWTEGDKDRGKAQFIRG